MKYRESSIGKGILYLDFLQNSDYAYYLSSRLTVYNLKEKRIVQQINQTGNVRFALSPDQKLLGCIHPNRSNIDVLLFSCSPLLTLEYRHSFKDVVSPILPVFSADSQYFYFLTSSRKVWVLNCCSGNLKCIYSCTAETAITSMDVNERGIVLTVYNHKGDADNQQIIVIDNDGEILHFIRFFVKNGEWNQRPFRCSWIDDAQLLCMFDLDHAKSSFQFIDVKKENHQVNPQYDTNVVPWYAKSMSISHNKKYMAVDGMFIEGYAARKKVSIYNLPDFHCLFSREYDIVWSAHFASNSNTLVVCGEKQYVINMDL